jgi:hypothetical protein
VCTGSVAGIDSGFDVYISLALACSFPHCALTPVTMSHSRIGRETGPFVAPQLQDGPHLTFTPCMECHHGNPQHKAISHFETRAAQDLAGGFGPDNCRELVFFREAHFGSAALAVC